MRQRAARNWQGTLPLLTLHGPELGHMTTPHFKGGWEMPSCGPGRRREAEYWYLLVACSSTTKKENLIGECVDQGQPDEAGQELRPFPSLEGMDQ